MREAGSSSRWNESEIVRQSIWKLKTPNGTKILIWRTCKDILPTLQNLSRRKVTENCMCPICGMDNETIGHALWGCPATQDVWSQACMKIQKISFSNPLFVDIWSKFIEKPSLMELNEATVIVKLIWSCRNDVVHIKTFTNPNAIILKTKIDFSSYRDSLKQ